MNRGGARLVIVTGGSRGIGAAVARLAATQGYAVAVNFLQNQRAARRVVEEIASSGGSAIPIKGDVAREADIIRLFKEAEEAFGPVYGLVNNAGITGGFARVEEIQTNNLVDVLVTNVAGTILCAREAVKRMSTQKGGHGGSIVNISSLAARTGGAGEWVHYAATKGAVNSFTVGLDRHRYSRFQWRTGSVAADESLYSLAPTRDGARSRRGRRLAAFGCSFLYHRSDS